MVQSVGRGYEPPHRARVGQMAPLVSLAAGLDSGMAFQDAGASAPINFTPSLRIVNLLIYFQNGNLYALKNQICIGRKQ